MKRLLFLSVFIITLIPCLFAYDFAAMAPSGQILYFNITGDNTVEITNPGFNNYSASISGDLVISDSVTHDGNTYFVTRIGSSAFYKCTGLTSVTIPNSVTSISSLAFYECISLTSVTIPNSVTSISSAFYECRGLMSVTIPSSVTDIISCAFYHCSNLRIVNYTGTIAQWCGINFSNDEGSNPIYYSHSLNINGSPITELVIPDEVSEIKNNVFNNFSTLTSVIIGNSVTNIGAFSFGGCTGLTSISIPNSVTSVGESAFHGCDHITNIILGNGLQSIGVNAFSGCTQVVRIKSYATIAPTIQSNTFSDLSDDVIVNVPCGYAPAYENAAYWHRFDIQEDLMYNFSATSSDPSRGTVQIINTPTCSNAEAEIKANPYHGFHFVRWSDGNTEAHRYLVVVQDTALQAEFAEGNVGIDDIEAEGISIYSAGGRIVVEGTTDEVNVFDMMGRRVRNVQLPDGVYMVKVGTLPARKVVVIR